MSPCFVWKKRWGIRVTTVAPFVLIWGPLKELSRLLDPDLVGDDKLQGFLNE